MAMAVLTLLVAMGTASTASASLLSYGDFEPDQPTTIVEMPTTYVVGTGPTNIWSTRLGTGTQQVAYLDDGAGNHFVSVGTSVNQPGIFQVVPWPGHGTAQLSYTYSGPRAIVRIFGAETGDTIAKFSGENSLTLIQQIDNPAVTEWTTVTHQVELSGAYDYLVVRFGTSGTSPSLYDDISMTVPVPAPDTAPVIVTESLPATQVGAAYVATLEAEGGNGALTWSLAAGVLPAGLTLSEDGFISGVPTTAGTSTFTVRVVDADDNVSAADASTKEFSLVVNVPVPPVASLVVTRTSGVAPLAVSFDATGSTSLLTARPFHDLHYHWNYGDPGSGVWATSRKSKNEDLGAIGGHVYETPGVYTATLTVKDATGASSQATVEITVEDPDVVFAGTNTICISTDGDFTGAPAGSLHVTSDSWATIASSLGTGKRVLLKRGNTWVSDGSRITMNFAGPGILGAFGTGPKPIITFAADGTGWTFFMGNGNTPYQFGDFRFMDFEIQGRGFNYSGFHAEGAFNNLTILRVDASEMGVFLNLSPPILRYYNNDNRPGHRLWEGVAVVETKYEKVVGDGGEFNGRHIAYAGMARSLYMGNIWNNAERGEHILRVPLSQRFIIAHNQLTNARLTKHLIKMHGGGTDDDSGQILPPGENQTKLITISDNYFSSRLGDWLISVGPQNGTSAEVTRDIIVERNEVVFGEDNNIAFHMAASSTTVRNNTVIMTGAAGNGTIAMFDRRGIEPVPTDNYAYNNSAYSGNAQGFTLVGVVASAINTTVRNNYGRSVGASKTLISGGGTNLVQSNNVITDTPGWVVADPTAAHHFDLVDGSPAIGAGYPVPLLADFEGQPRQPNAGISLGAFESPPTTPDIAPVILSTTIKNGAYGEPYWVTLEGDGGNGRLYWTLASGSLPAGLELRSNGQIVGKPASSGSFTFVVSLEDSDGAIGGSDAAQRTFTLEIAAEPNSVPQITATNVPAAIVGASYSRTLTAIDGNGALTWTLASGALPPGFSLSSEGVITGMATATGAYEFTVAVADSDGAVGAADEDTATYTLVVNPVGSVTAYQGSTFYNQAFAAQAGQFEATFNVHVPSFPINAPIGLSFGPATAYAQMAAIVSFSADGYLNARNGGAYTYTAPAINYAEGMNLRYRLVVDVPAKKYSVYVSVDGGAEQLLADNFNFRTEQASVASLNNLSVKVDAPVGGWISVTNFAVTPIGQPNVPVTGVSVAPSSVSMEVGETATLTATVAPANATNPIVSWYSTAPAVASVDQNGLVTAISAGSATIVATTLDGHFTASSAVTVAGTPGELSVTIFADAGVHDFGGVSGALDTEIFRSGTASWRITYNSDSATSAFIPQGAALKMADLTSYANNGYFEFWYRSSKAGTMRFQVMDGGATNATIFQADRALVATTEWTRVEIPFTGWTQAPTSTPNWKLMLRGWIGMNGATVHYDDIRFVGLAPDPVDVPVTGVSVSPSTLSLDVGGSAALTATVAPANATNPAVSWSTSDASVATVSETGVVTAIAPGQADITVTTADGGFTASASVTVTADPGSVPEIVTTTLPSGEVGVLYSETLAATGGDGALVWTLASGSLPDGLSLSADGTIAGTPTTEGSSTFTVRVSDSDDYEGSDDEDTQSFTLTIEPAAPVEAEVVLLQLNQRYDGLPKPVLVGTDPEGLNVVVTYNGSPEAPIYPGVYEVVAQVDEDGYVGEATAELTIGITALVRHGFSFSGEIDGSVQVLLPESTTLNGGAGISNDLLVSGLPEVKVYGNATYVAVIEADGAATPTNHRVTLNDRTVVRYVVRQVDAIELPTVDAPAAPTGTRDVSVNQSGQAIGDPATLRNLTINRNGGDVTVPPGAYGDFISNGGAFVLGVAGATEPAMYDLRSLTLNSNAQLKVVGPVILTVRQSVSFNSAKADGHDAAALTLRVHAGDVTLNGSTTLNGTVIAPSGQVSLNGSSVIRGSVAADRLTLNKQAVLKEPDL